MFLVFRDEVAAAMQAALAMHSFPSDDHGVEDPPEDVDAILASSIAFRLAGVVGDEPSSIASLLADSIDPSPTTYIDSVSTAGPYVNFHPTTNYYSDTVTASMGADFGRLPPTGSRVVVEHTSANPTGPVHVGRARNPIIGDSVARLLDYAGNDVDRHYYVNDAGRQVAVLTWAAETFEESDLPPMERDRPDYDLVRYYRYGSRYLESADDQTRQAAEAEIQTIIHGIETGDAAVYERVSTVVDRVLSGMKASLDRLPAEFDEFIRETRFINDSSVSDLVERLMALEAAVYEDDAWQLDLSSDGIDKWLVFLRSDGTSLYTTRDIAHHEWKLDEYDRAITVLGEDHKLQAAQLSATLNLLGHDTQRLDSIFYSWVTLPEGGMSTREGTGIDLDDLLDEAISRARDEVESRLGTRIRDDSLDEKAIDRIARQVGIAAVRFDIVSKQPTKGLVFDWDQALDFEAQSAPYVQYVHARCCGILQESKTNLTEADPGLLVEPPERALIETISRFPAVVESAASALQPHDIATYTRTLAERFNVFYRECPVLSASTAEKQDARLALVIGTKNTIANSLDILGIEAPDSM